MTSRTPLACLVVFAALASALILGPGSASASGCVVITATTNPCASLQISKYGPTYANSGTDVTYEFDVYNNGQEPVDNIQVTDDQCPNVTGPDGDTGDAGVLLPYSPIDGYNE